MPSSSAYATRKDLAVDLDKGRIHHVYLFLGEEEGDKDKAINKIIDMVLTDDAMKRHSTGRFHLENNEIMEAVDFTLSQSMFSSNRVCIMYNIERIASNQVSSSMLKETLLAIPDTAKLILTTVDKKPPAFLGQELLKKIRIIQFWKYYSSDLFKYIKMSLAKSGMQIEERAVDLLMERTGNDIRSIDEALEMMRMSGEHSIITPDMIREYVSVTRSSTIFEFIDSLFLGDGKTIRKLHTLLEDGANELSVVHMIARQCELLERYHQVRIETRSMDAALDKCGISQRNRPAFMNQAQLFPPERLRKVFPLIMTADFELKSSRKFIDPLSNPVVVLTSAILLMQ